MTSSWKTTAAAVLALVVLVLSAAQTIITGGIGAIDWGVFIPQLVAAAGLLFARDNNVTSEDAGATPKTKFR